MDAKTDMNMEKRMSTKSCPVPTPEQKRFMEIRETVEKTMLDTIYKAIDDAAMEMADKVRSAGIDIPPTERDYFIFAAQQVLFVRLCGGDPDTLEDGDPEIGERIVRNGQHIIDHYWRGKSAQTSDGASR
ncbi:hypothetical protein [Ensifer canadensis]|nr:hypothetical protein [Ensifer canadensis]